MREGPTRQNESRVNNCLKRLLDRKAIDGKTYNLLRAPINGSRAPLFYGTVKIHKPDNPLKFCTKERKIPKAMNAKQAEKIHKKPLVL